MSDIIIKDIIQSETAVTSIKAEKVFEVLKENINKGEVSVLDFTGTKSVTTAFLNVAIGQLYDVDSVENLSKLVRLKRTTVSDEHFRKITRVLNNSRSKREAAQKNIEEVLDGE
ncbi:STAS-like domain-containing protein [Lactococcus lactis]|uniref:STAS-like domain-containing protein n=1 Tax=Lactococcus lactis TaxID=1358 RepID=UPI00071D65D6|nr:STAS-like domain-containing protein [Lactococcus lactis]KST85924.1 hypothetical protein KF7_0922 [Lactococcus lactis subsp. lactis]MDT2872030.1 STAS-like domain-containing protein [Lactococcus lactis]MDT2933921.1 STAS-like domain-containing protein [Lactococcus lactis]MDU0404057.1 hypothetical protein [Lactococcus lactis]